MKAGSFFFAEIRRITSSSSPGATVSLAMSVTKPWRYLRATRVSSSGCLADMVRSAPRRRAGREREARKVRRRERRVAPQQRLEAHVRERAPYGVADALPAVADEAGGLDAAMPRAARAFGERDRAFDRVDDVGGADRGRRAGELVAAVGAAHGTHEARVLEFLEQLADRREADVRALGDARRAREVAAREACEDHGRVVRQAADAQHR